MWNTFEKNRLQLEKQFKECLWDVNTGESPEKLMEACKVIDARSDLPRSLIKSEIIYYLASNAQIMVNPLDWFADSLNHAGITDKIRQGWIKEMNEGELHNQVNEYKTLHDSYSCLAEIDFGHTSPDWQAIMDLGIVGLLERVRNARDSKENLTVEQKQFFDAAEMEYEAAIVFIERLARQAKNLADKDEKMSLVAQSLHNLTIGAPQTMLEAMQLTCIWNTLQHELEAVWLRSLGGLDRLYYRFYKQDLASGRYTEEQLRELVRYFFFHFYAKAVTANMPFYLGGRDMHGQDTLNPLSYLLVEEYRKLNIHDPKLHIRYHENIAPDFLDLVLSCIREGNNSFVFINDPVAEAGLVKLGETPEEANNYVPVGCYECAALGKEVPCSVSGRLNLVQVLTIAMHNGYDAYNCILAAPPSDIPIDTDFDAFYEYFLKLTEYFLNIAMQTINAYEERADRLVPAPMFSGTFSDCIECGKDAYEGGVKYANSSINAFGLATVVDSLLAIRHLVFEEKMMSLKELVTVLDDNWRDQENLRHHIQTMYPKYGNNLPESDTIMVDLVKKVSSMINGKPNGRHGIYRCGFFSIDWNLSFGKHTGATPDGRLAGELFSRNMSAVTAQDKQGVTALIQSVTKIDYSIIPNGSVLDLMLHASAVAGEEGMRALTALIKTYFKCGGFAVQINVLDPQVLRQAQLYPEQYTNLQVRLCGWNVHFVDLSKEEQDDFIRRSEHSAN